MSKSILSRLAAVALASASVCAANADVQTLTIADGTATNVQVPFYFTYLDAFPNISQMVYPAEMLTELQGKTITGLRFYAESDFNTDMVMDYTVYIGTTTNPYVYEGTPNPAEPYGTPGELTYGQTTVAFNGTQNNASGDVPFEVNFQTPYTYTGGNLLVELANNKAGSGYQSSLRFLGATQTAFTSANKKSACFVFGFLPKTTFSYTDDSQEYGVSISPAFIDFRPNVVGDSETRVVKLLNYGTQTITVENIASPDAPFSISYPDNLSTIAPGETVEINVTFSPTEAGDADDLIEITFAEAQVGTRDISLSATAVDLPQGYDVALDDPANLPDGFSTIRINKKENADQSVTTTYFAEDFLTSFTAGGVTGVANVNGNPFNTQYDGKNYYYLITPKILTGEVMLNVRSTGENSSALWPPKVYVATPGSEANEWIINYDNPVSLEWLTPYDYQDWSWASFTLTQDNHLGIFMEYGAVSRLAATGATQGIERVRAALNDDITLQMSANNLALTSSTPLVSMNIFNISGAEVFTRNLSNTYADTPLDLPAGIYLVRVQSTSNVRTFKVIVK